jgi:excisionase family DNA binding protein
MSAITSRLRPVTAVKAARPWLTVKEAAEYLGVGIDTIYAACAKRGLKHVKLGHSTIRLRPEWIDAWAETLTRQAP